MADRWFSEEELEQMSRPTMDRAIAAMDRGDIDAARVLCEEMKHEWRYLHDLMVEGIAGLISFVQERLGDEGVADAWTSGQGRGWRRDVEAIAKRDRRQIVLALAATWRAHSCSGTGPHPGAFTVTEDDEKFTFEMHPCGSGQRLVRMGRYEGSQRARKDPVRARLELRPQGLSALLHALLVHERVTSDPLDRLSALPERSSGRLRQRPVHLVLVQGPGRHPRPALGAPRVEARRRCRLALRQRAGA